MTHQVCADAPDFIKDHPVQRRPKKPNVSSTDNLLEPMVFTKLQLFKWTVKVRDWATIREDTELLGRLSAGDMVAQDAKYHKKCLSVLHIRVRKVESEGPKYKANEREVAGIVFASLYIEEARLDEETAQVFKLAYLVELYQSRMQQLGVKLDTRVHSTRLKQGLLAHFPDRRAHTKGRDVLLVFEEDVVVGWHRGHTWKSSTYEMF